MCEVQGSFGPFQGLTETLEQLQGGNVSGKWSTRCVTDAICLRQLRLCFSEFEQKADAGRSVVVLFLAPAGGASVIQRFSIWFPAEPPHTCSAHTPHTLHRLRFCWLSGSVLDRLTSHLTGRTSGVAVNSMSDTY